MVKEAEDYADEDRKIRDRTDSRNSLESYLYNVKNSLTGDGHSGVAENLREADKEVGDLFFLCYSQFLDTNRRIITGELPRNIPWASGIQRLGGA